LTEALEELRQRRAELQNRERSGGT
jgi:hypothetical protein